MKSKITIDLAEDNQPIIKVDYVYSEDVRDKMVKRFLERFGGASCWARFRYTTSYAESEYGGTSRTAEIKPIPPEDLIKEGEEVELMAKALTEIDSTLKN